MIFSHACPHFLWKTGDLSPANFKKWSIWLQKLRYWRRWLISEQEGFLYKNQRLKPDILNCSHAFPQKMCRKPPATRGEQLPESRCSAGFYACLKFNQCEKYFIKQILNYIFRACPQASSHNLCKLSGFLWADEKKPPAWGFRACRSAHKTLHCGVGLM